MTRGNMTRVITKIDAVNLACGLQQILLDKVKKGEDAVLPCQYLEQLVMERHGVSKKEAEKVTEAVINTGILRWEKGILSNNR